MNYDPDAEPGQPGYLGHKTGPGLMKRWRPKTMRNQKKKGFFSNKENWHRFKLTAGIPMHLRFHDAWKLAGIHEITLAHYVNGMTDTKLSTALDLCDKLGCRLEGFARAMIEAWEIAERRYETKEAIEEASREE